VRERERKREEREGERKYERKGERKSVRENKERSSYLGWCKGHNREAIRSPAADVGIGVKDI
jgi:hypothetical protein